MAVKRIYCDKSEIVLYVVGKNKVQSMNVTYDRIVNVRFEKCKEFQWFRFVPSEKICITVSGRGEPVEYTKMKEKKFFKEYKMELEEFCKRNRVTFYKNI